MKRTKHLQLTSLFTAMPLGALCAIMAIMMLLSSCTLWKKAKANINYAPMIYVESKALGQVKSTHFYLFDKSGVLAHDTIIRGDGWSTSQQLLARNLFAGEYRLLAYSNLGQMQMPVVQRGVTRIESLKFAADGFESYDSVRYHSSSHILERQKIVTADLLGAPCFYHLTITVVGLEQLTIPLEEPTFRLFDLPSVIDCEGHLTGDKLLEVTPILHADDKGMMRSSEIMCMRFTDISQAKFQILNKGRSIHVSTLLPSEFISFPSQTKVDIKVVFEPDRVTVLVNDWFAGGTDLLEIGG